MPHPPRPIRSTRLLPALLLATAFTAACGDDPVEPRDPMLASVRGAPGSLVIVPDVFCPIGGDGGSAGTMARCGTITAGDSIHFIAYEIGDDGTAREARGTSWAVSEEKLATVSREGWVRGVEPGEVTLIANVGPRSADTVLTIEAARIVSVRISAGTAALPVGGTLPLAATLVDVLGNEMPAKAVDWYVHNTAVATVDPDGTVHGLADGHVIVSAFGPDNSGGWIDLTVGTGVPAGAGFALAGSSVGGHHACGVGAAGEGYCWGWNYYGQLGQGYFSEEDVFFPSPLRVRSKAPFREVSAGSFHSCAVGTDDAAWCWGDNGNGRLGAGTAGAPSPVPLAVEGGAVYRTISAGGDHTCALRTDGAAVCWGANYTGQLGNGTAGDAPSPAPVAGATAFTAIRAGLWHSCGLDPSGAAWCWGDNSFGQVGNGNMMGGAPRGVPTAVRSTARFTVLETSSAGSHTCGLTPDGEAWCWGRNDSGQLGDGTTESRNRPTPVATSLRFGVIAPASHHTCALTTDGAAWCWGDNSAGQLGDNSLTGRRAPVAVATALRFETLQGTNNVTCGRTSAGETYCWGSNWTGTLGAGLKERGAMAASPLPVAQP